MPQKFDRRVLALCIGLGAAAVAGVLLALAVAPAGGSAVPGSPEPLAAWAIPVVKSLFYLAMAATIGSLVFAAWALGERGAALARALGLAAGAGASWLVFGLLNLALVFIGVTGTSFGFDERFGNNLWLFMTEIDLGRNLSLNLLAPAAITLLALVAQRLVAVALLALAGVASLVPLALTGHAAGAANHGMAVNSLGLHLLGASIWVGGLLCLLVLGRQEWHENGDRLVARYSTLALTGFALVTSSGVAAAWLRLGSFADLWTPYGQLLLLKSVGLVVLGLFGARYRLRHRLGFRLIAVELLVMAATIGIAAVLARTAPPLAEELVRPTPAQILTGNPLPPPLTALGWLTAFKLDLLWLLIGSAAIGLYIFGVRRLHSRGDAWPPGRTVSWILGWLLLIWVTSGPINAYQEYLFSAHMIGHMILAMGVGALMVPGAPITLISRAAAKRGDGSRGLREWALWLVHTRYARLVAHPLVAGVLFASSLVTFYYTPLFSWSTSDHIGHEWMVLHFLITGYLFAQALIGIDPGPARLPFAVRLLLLIGTMAFHAFFGLSLMSGSGLLLPEWYGAMGRTWGEPPLADQQTGGAIAWGIGEIPTAMLTLIVCVQWYRSDQREAKRRDRSSDKSGGADIEEYNRMLARLGESEEKRP